MNRKINEIDYDARMLSLSRNDGGAFTPLQVKEASDYLEMRRNKDPQRFDDYLPRVVKRADELIGKQEIKDMAKTQLGEEFSRVVTSIFDNKVKDKMLVLNNRYPIVYQSGDTIPVGQIEKTNSVHNKQIKFMLLNGLLTADEYAFSIAFDKDGNPRMGISEDDLNQEVIKRYADAASFPGVKKTIEGGKDEVEYDEILKAFKKFSADRYILKQRIK